MLVNDVGKPDRAWPPRITNARPRYAASVPRVTARDGRLSTPISSPLTRPSPPAIARPIAVATQTSTPLCQSCANDTADTALVEQTERPISPAITTDVRPPD